MSRRPIVISPIAPVLQRDDAEIALITVEAWRSETIVRLAALVPDPVAEEAAHEDAISGWVAAGRTAPAPMMPGERHFQDITVSFSDDLGTIYRLRSSVVGGSGRMFRGDWHFATGVPDAARVLTVTAVNQLNGEEGSTSLPL